MFDVAIIGAGTGGLTAARLLAQSGKRVALFERGRPGGDCLWTGCVPTKALIHAARRYHEARTGERFGVIGGDVALDYAAVRRHIADAQERAGRVDTPEVIRSWGVTLVEGDARFIDEHAVDVGGARIQARSFVIATGTTPSIPPIPGIENVPVDTNVEVLDWERLPRSLAVVGGGPIGLEFGQAMARFGVQVTIIEQASRLLPTEAENASGVIATVLRREGIEVLTNASLERVADQAGDVRLSLDVAGENREISSERLLVAAGRKPSLRGLRLESAGIDTTDRGITVDEYLRTSRPHIYAVGDVNGGPQFTHVAEDQGRTVARSIVQEGRRFGRPARWNSRVVPRVTYTDPEVASVGLAEDIARRTRRGVRAWTVPLEEVDRAITMGATEGFVKLTTARGWQHRIPGLAGKLGDEIVGATIVAPHAGDLLMPIVMAMRARLPMGMVAWNMQAYPTLSLGVRQAAGLPFESGG